MPPAVWRDRQTDGGRGEERRGEERRRATQPAAAARLGEKGSNARVRDGKERKAMESISATSFSVKGPLLCLPPALPHVTSNCKK